MPFLHPGSTAMSVILIQQQTPPPTTAIEYVLAYFFAGLKFVVLIYSYFIRDFYLLYANNTATGSAEFQQFIA